MSFLLVDLACLTKKRHLLNVKADLPQNHCEKVFGKERVTVKLSAGLGELGIRPRLKEANCYEPMESLARRQAQYPTTARLTGSSSDPGNQK